MRAKIKDRVSPKVDDDEPRMMIVPLRRNKSFSRTYYDRAQSISVNIYRQYLSSTCFLTRANRRDAVGVPCTAVPRIMFHRQHRLTDSVRQYVRRLLVQYDTSTSVSYHHTIPAGTLHRRLFCWYDMAQELSIRGIDIYSRKRPSARAACM